MISRTLLIMAGLIIDWVNTVFPEDIQDILINPNFHIDNTTESDCDDISDEEDEI